MWDKYGPSRKLGFFQGLWSRVSVAKFSGLKIPWALKAPDGPQAPKAPERKFCPWLSLATSLLSILFPTTNATPNLDPATTRILNIGTKLMREGKSVAPVNRLNEGKGKSNIAQNTLKPIV